MLDSEEFIKLLSDNNYDYQIHRHEALFTVEDSYNLRGKIKGSHSKNLFLKNKKDKFFLISCEEFTNINLKNISKSLGLGNISFARDEYLQDLLNIKPGSVTPFALLNDQKNNVNFYLEDKLFNSDFVNFHPLINTATITMSCESFVKLMIENNKKIHIFSIESETIIKTYGE